MQTRMWRHACTAMRVPSNSQSLGQDLCNAGRPRSYRKTNGWPQNSDQWTVQQRLPPDSERRSLGTRQNHLPSPKSAQPKKCSERYTIDQLLASSLLPEHLHEKRKAKSEHKRKIIGMVWLLNCCHTTIYLSYTFHHLIMEQRSCYVQPCSALHCIAQQFCTALHYTAIHTAQILLECTTLCWHCIPPHCIALHPTLQCMLYFIVLCCIVLCSAVLRCCTVPYHTVTKAAAN